jgi:hypothetical protein
MRRAIIAILCIVPFFAGCAEEEHNEYIVDLSDFLAGRFASAGSTDAVSSDFGGSVSTDPGVSPDTSSTFEEVTVTYTAPEGATAVDFCSNFRGEWLCEGTVAGRTISWSGRLSAERLTWPSCTAHARDQACGYVVNPSFNKAPFHAVDAPEGVLREQGTISGSSSSGANLLFGRVENGLDGGNFWVHTP